MRSVELRLLELVLAIGSVVHVTGCGIAAHDYVPAAPSAPVLAEPLNDSYLPPSKDQSLRPRFSWQPSVSGTNEVRYELQYSSDERFSAAVTTVSVADTAHQSSTSLEVSTIPPVGRRYYWRVRACVESACSEYSASWRVNVGRSEKDLNGDGYADVVVGAPVSDEIAMDAGRVYVYFGRSGNPDSTPDGVISGRRASDMFGTSVAILGDVNADGFADLAVGAPGDDEERADAGSVFLYFGGAGATFDVVDDALISGGLTGESFGWEVAGPGDLNSDGYADVVVAAPQSSGNGTYSGRVYVHFGGTGDALNLRRAKLQGAAAGERFGDSISAIGDFNGDGAADLLVNRGQASASCSSSVYLGGPGTLFDPASDHQFVALSPGACELLMRGAGDVNGDGRDDLAAVTRHTSAGDLLVGEAYVYVTPSIPVDVVDISSTGVLISSAATPVYSIAAAGDVNDDGRDDVVTNHLENGGLYLGRSNDSQPLGIGGAFSLSGLRSIGAAGDVNGDGVEDLVLGSISGVGSAHLYLGGEGEKLDTVSDVAFSAGTSGSGYGFAVAVRQQFVCRWQSTKRG